MLGQEAPGRSPKLRPTGMHVCTLTALSHPVTSDLEPCDMEDPPNRETELSWLSCCSAFSGSNTYLIVEKMNISLEFLRTPLVSKRRETGGGFQKSPQISQNFRLRRLFKFLYIAFKYQKHHYNDFYENCPPQAEFFGEYDVWNIIFLKDFIKSEGKFSKFSAARPIFS